MYYKGKKLDNFTESMSLEITWN